jgi:hypothetical protein
MQNSYLSWPKLQIALYSIKIRVKYIFASCSLKTLFLGPCASFYIVDGISFMDKEGDGTIVQLPSKNWRNSTSASLRSCHVSYTTLILKLNNKTSVEGKFEDFWSFEDFLIHSRRSLRWHCTWLFLIHWFK